MSHHNSSALNLNVSSSAGFQPGQLKDKLSHQLENIVRKTEKNLNTGVFKMPSSMTPMNAGKVGISPSYRASSQIASGLK
jgi:hypothetical protein